MSKPSSSRRFGRNSLQRITYFVLLPFVYAFGCLPFGVLHRLSDVAAFVAYRVIGFRRRVVRENLRGCLPDARPEDLERYATGSYRHAFDVFVEVLRLLAVGTDEALARVSVDLGPAASLGSEKRSFIVVLGHSGNWEWAIPAAVHAFPGMRVHVVYHPLKHTGFDRLLRELRERAGALLSPMDRAARRIARMRREPTVTVLLADQRPRRRNGRVIRFFGRDTLFFQGPERIARRLDLPVVYAAMNRIGRGRYELRAEWLCEHPADSAEGEITERFAQRLEAQIRSAPENWLWNHRRWRDRRTERGAESATQT